MTCTVKQLVLERAIRIVWGAVGKHEKTPSLRNIMLTGDEHRLSLHATNLTTWIRHDIEVEGSPIVGIALPPKMLRDTVNLLDGDLELSTDGPHVTLVSQRFQIKSTHAVGYIRSAVYEPDYFELPIPEADAWTVTFDARRLKTALEGVVFAAAKDDTRPPLQMVRVEIEGNQATFVATDGFQMAVTRCPITSSSPRCAVSFFAETAKLVAKTMGFGEVTMTVMPTQKRVSFANWGTAVAGYADADKWVDWRRQYDQPHDSVSLTVDRLALLQALRFAELSGRNHALICRLAANGKWLIVGCAEDIFGSHEAAVPIVQQTTPIDLDICLNVQFCVNILRRIVEPTVRIRNAGSSAAPLLFCKTDGSQDIMLMPMSVRGKDEGWRTSLVEQLETAEVAG